ncbi:MAG: hypothetical protein ACR2H3_04960 [Acidimicrobiales bacterium]
MSGEDLRGDLDDALDDVVDEPTAGEMVRLAKALADSARTAGAQAVASGRWLATTIVDVAPRIPVRDLATLERQTGLTGEALAAELVRGAARTSAAIGAVGGAMVSAGALAPPTWIAIPFALVAQTFSVAAVELKLIAELHEVFGRPVAGSPADRTSALIKAWAERRGVSVTTLATSDGLASALGRGTRNELIRLVRRRLVARTGRSMTTLIPLFVGAVAGAEVNRRGTKSLGEAVMSDLARATERAEPAAGMEG